MAVEEREVAELKDADVEEMSADDIEETFVPRPKDEVVGLEMDGEAVLVVEGSWSTHWLNQISTVVWNSLDGVSSVRELSAELARAFGADPEVVLSDVLEVTRQFGMAGLLEGVAEASTGGNPQGVAKGKPIPSFELPDTEGQTVSLESLRGQKLLLVNWSPTCGFCKQIAPELAELEPQLREHDIQPVLIATGEIEANRQIMEEAGLDALLLLQEPGEAEVFSGMGTPVAYLVDEEGKNAASFAYGSDAVPALARKAAGLPPKESGDNGHDHAH
ncbi:MAG TPA: PqqD family peptide modification chaperone [Actinomycetota bacterium]|nr:PqqD family peptide modification chaperone [Actinomycetota bacterium]